MDARSITARNMLIAPRKLRLVARSVVGLPINQAKGRLSLITHKGAHLVAQVIHNAQVNYALADTVQIRTIEVGEGMKLKRYMLAYRGVARKFMKQRSHIRITFADNSSPIPTGSTPMTKIVPQKINNAIKTHEST